MKRFLLLCAVVSFAFPSRSWSQVCKDVAVRLEARIDSSTGRKDLVIRWAKFDSVTLNQLYRRIVGASNWGTAQKLGLTDLQYRDTLVKPGIAYEYRVQQNHKVAGTTLTATGYLQGGIEIPAVRDRGGIFLLIDSTYANDLAPELTRLEADLKAEGWSVKRMDVARRLTPIEIKDQISSIYITNPTFWKSLFVVGHVPVPYSGFMNPDGHPDHIGAWPTDLYYGELDGDWTDDVDESDVIADTTGIRKANLNKIGDGKFDNSQLPDDVDLMTGRVDFNNMPAFSKTEKELLKQYLDKDHNFRVGIMTAPHRGLVDDNFGYFSGEAFASSGWRNLAPLVGIDSVKEIDWFTTLSTQPYLWAYGTGGGWDQGAGGVGSTDDFAKTGSKAIFTMLFGSYFGDWNTQNNFLRAPLASEYGLSCAWSGRPYWYFFPMALGETIGYCAMLSQNNVGGYIAKSSTHSVHMEFLGDPTLRMNPIAPPTALFVITIVKNNVANLQWGASTEKNIIGYNVYRAHSANEPYKLITPQPLKDPSFTDTEPLPDSDYYVVHAVRLETTPSGSYYNLSPGIFGLSIGLKGLESVAVPIETKEMFVIQTSISAQIVFTPTQSSHYSIEVVDATGRGISEVFSGSLSAGRYRFDMNTSNLSSGLYFVRVSGGRTPETAKMLIVR